MIYPTDPVQIAYLAGLQALAALKIEGKMQ